jgi:hypothetical protein
MTVLSFFAILPSFFIFLYLTNEREGDTIKKTTVEQLFN